MRSVGLSECVMAQLEPFDEPLSGGVERAIASSRGAVPTDSHPFQTGHCGWLLSFTPCRFSGIAD